MALIFAADNGRPVPVNNLKGISTDRLHYRFTGSANHFCLNNLADTPNLERRGVSLYLDKAITQASYKAIHLEWKKIPDRGNWMLDCPIIN